MSVTMTRPQVAAGRDAGARPWTFARGLAVFGAVLLAYEAITIVRWLASGPTQVTADRDTSAASFVAAQIYLAVMIAVSIWVLVFVVRQCRRAGRLTFDAQMIIGCGAALFWDPFGNFIQPAFFYSSNWINLNTWAGDAPGVVNTDAGLMPQPVFIMLVYPFGLLVFTMFSNLVMRATRRRFPGWSNARVLAVGSVTAFFAAMTLEAPMFLLHLWSLPGAPAELSLFDDNHRYASVEYLTTAMVFAGLAAVRFFKDDHGRAFTERGVSQTGAVLAVVGWCCSLLLVLQLFVTYFAFKADPYPEGFPPHLVNGLCDVGATTDTHYGPCPGSPGFRLPTSLPD